MAPDNIHFQPGDKVYWLRDRILYAGNIVEVSAKAGRTTTYRVENMSWFTRDELYDSRLRACRALLEILKADKRSLEISIDAITKECNNAD